MSRASTAVVDQPSDGAGVERSASADSAASPEPGVETQDATLSTDSDAAAEPTEDVPADDANDLLSQDQFEALKGDPSKLRRELNRAATKKFQQLAAQRKELEPYTEFIRDLQADPVAAIRSVAPHFGLTITDPAATTREEQVKDINAQVIEAVRTSLGPEYDDLADRLGPAIKQVAEMVVTAAAKPIVDRQDELVRESAARESAAVLEAFGKKHPDWKKHEPQMVEIAKRYQVQPGVKEGQYLEDLYYLATRDQSVGEAVKRTLSRMTDSAHAAAKDASAGVSANKVSPTAPGPVSFREAWAAAKRGQRLE
jgi:hypothetical protein